MELLKVRRQFSCFIVFEFIHGSTYTGPEFEDPVPPQLVFNVGSTSVCTDITINTDGVHENNETFSVALSSTSDRINFAVGTATVQIIDNDGKQSMHLHAFNVNVPSSH